LEMIVVIQGNAVPYCADALLSLTGSANPDIRNSIVPR
jgi:hypothetical protein